MNMPGKKEKQPLSVTHPELAMEADGWDPSHPLPIEFEHKTDTTDLVVFSARATKSFGGLEGKLSVDAE